MRAFTTKISLLVNSLVLLFLIMFGIGEMRNAQAESTLANISNEDRYCLQQNIYFEARNQSEMGMIAVAWVTMNRVDSKRYPSSICNVVWQKKQFSWTHDGLSDKPGKNSIEQRAWKRAEHVMSLVLYDWAYGNKNAVDEATHYHADYVNPYWTSSFQKVAQVDNHIFYRK